jgi:hypothetical protein
MPNRDVAEGIVAGTVKPLEGARFLFGNHRARTFDPIAFHHWLEGRVIEDGEVRLDLLLELAKCVVIDASLTIWDALDWVRYDRELLEMDPRLTDCGGICSH